jgi:hypothetical protein
MRLTVALSSLLFAGCWQPETIDLRKALQSASELNGVSGLTATAEGLSLQVDGPDAFFVIPFSGALKWQKLQFEVDLPQHVTQAALYWKRPGEAFSEDQVLAMTAIPGTGVYEVLLEPGEYGPLRIDLDVDAPGTRLELRRPQLVSFSLLDQKAMQKIFSFIIVLALALACLLPGLMVASRLHHRPAQPLEPAFEVAFVYSLIFYLALYLALIAVPELFGGSSASPVVFLALWLVALVGLGAAARWNVVVGAVWNNAGPLAWFIALLLVATYLLCFDSARPLYTMDFTQISGWKTFGAVQAHDNYFQYVNGKAIAEHEPFSRYYADGRLTYDVTAREMLPGAIYAVFRKLFTALSWRLGDSFLVYTLLGTVCNALVVLPLAALSRRFFPTVALWKVALALAASSSFFINVYYTWFKYAGAALFLSAMVILLADRERWSRWLLAGVLVGASANMHTGNLLGLPAFLAYFAWTPGPNGPRPALLRWGGPALTAVTVLALLFPWNVVKAKWLHVDNTLIVQHYLDGHQRPEGLRASMRAFWEQTPLVRQFSYRWERLLLAFRLDDLGNWIRAFGVEPLRQQWVRLGWLEVRYLAPIFYPLGAFAIAAWLQRRQRPSAGPQRRAFFLLAAATSFVLVIASFGVFPADINFSQPMAVILICSLCLAGWALEAGGAVATVFLCFCALQVLRSLAVVAGHYVQYFQVN